MRIRILDGRETMITMTEIARLAKVSQPTVSRVLNGNMNVAPELRERVLACIKEYDYQPNALAKGLQGSQTHLLGVLLTDISNGFSLILQKPLRRKHGNTDTASFCSTVITIRTVSWNIWMLYAVTGWTVSLPSRSARPAICGEDMQRSWMYR